MAKKPPKKSRQVSQDDPVHYTAVLVEGLRSDFKFVIEKVDGLEERLIRRMDEGFELHDERFDRIEAVLKTHSQMLQDNEGRWQQNDERWKQNDVRLERIEGKLNHVIEKVERHDQEIQRLKTA